MKLEAMLQCKGLWIALVLIGVESGVPNSSAIAGLLSDWDIDGGDLISQETNRLETITEPTIPETIAVREFMFEGNTAFTDRELAAVLAPFIGSPISWEQLLQAEAAITQYYTDAGYVNSGAVIPAHQTFAPNQAVVKIQIIEGAIEDIQVAVNGRLNPNYIRSRLDRATKTPFNQQRLLEALQLLQLDPRIANISAELSAGIRPELSLLQVSVEEADPFQVEFFADNGRAPSVGSFRRGVNLNHQNLLGFGDRFSVAYTNTDGSNALDLSYSFPVNSRNGVITVAGGFTDTEVIEPPFDRIDITGDSRRYELSFRQPLHLTPTQEFALGLTASRQESKTQLLGEDFPLSPGANKDGETRISALRFFQEWTQRGPREVLAARSQFNLGLGIFDATENESEPDSRFFSWRGQAQYVRSLAPEALLVVRSDVQLSTTDLVPLEEFGLGGLRTVRGYRQDALLTDNGALVSAELRWPILTVNKIDGVMQIVPFVDLGLAWNSGNNPDPNPNTLLGIGMGLQFAVGDRLNARLDWGFPLTDLDSQERTWQENGLYFSVNVNPF
jgi:hemolysin activation/secretion protein